MAPATRLKITTLRGHVESSIDVPAQRFRHVVGERYTARRKAEAESMVRSGNWAHDTGN